MFLTAKIAGCAGLIRVGDFDRGVWVRLVRIRVGIGIGVGIVLRSAASSGGTLVVGRQGIEISISRGSLWFPIVAFSFPRHCNGLGWGFRADIESIAMLLFV